jgi:hypothetical protein
MSLGKLDFKPHVIQSRIGLQNCGAPPPRGAVGPLGELVVYMRDIFILNEIWAQVKVLSRVRFLRLHNFGLLLRNN